MAISHLHVQHELVGLTRELDEIIHDFAYLADRHKEFHPANSGDISQVLDKQLGAYLVHLFNATASSWIEISKIESLASLRNDGRTGYRSEGIKDPAYYDLIRSMAGRVMLITRTGAEISALKHSIDQDEGSKLLVVVEVDKEGKSVRLIFGNAQYGSIPSIELHVHLLGNGLSITEGWDNPSVVHAHPFHLVTLSREKVIAGNFQLFNAALYTQIEGINRNYPKLVGIVPYYPSGSSALVEHSMSTFQEHHLMAWMNHGFVVRERSIRMGYTLMAYADDSARAALDSLRFGSHGLPYREIDQFLKEKELIEAYKTLFSREV